ncbi:MAG: glycosyltransferase [Candidatus Woesearchaeota archaeon]
MKERKLIILAPEYDRFIKGSGEELANYFDNILVIIPKWKKIFGKTIFQTINKKNFTDKKNVKIITIKVSANIGLAKNKIKKIIKKARYENAEILSHFLVPYGALGNLINKEKNTIIGHGFDIYKFPQKNFLCKLIAKNIMKKCKKIITVSYANLKHIKKLGFKGKTIVIPNGFNSEKFKPLKNKNKLKEQLHIPKDKKILLHVGNLVPVKNHKNLIKAINELRKERQDFILYCVGGGVEEKNIRNQFKNLKLKKYVKLIGVRPHDEIPKWMNVADLFVLPSYIEGNPTVMFESLACGTPYVGTTVGGVGEIITSDEYGLLYKNPNNYKKLKELINKGLNKKWNKKEILSYSKKYTWKNITKKLSEEL